jgi:drug/metabolite transporter (DMT)-like permease
MVLCVGLSEAAGFTLSTLGQMHISAHRATILYSLEGVMACVFAYLFLGLYPFSPLSENLDCIDIRRSSHPS